MEKIDKEYGPKMLNVVKETLKIDYSSKIMHEALQEAHSDLDIDVKTTLTDSFDDRF